MNKSIKNIFAITALTLTFAPALRCEDTQTVSTSKLQSAINYIKNIRTPLTPQEILVQHIAHADVTGFKSDYDTFMQSDVTPEERIATLQALAITAQEVKQALQTELDTMGHKVKKTTLAKGVAQTVGGLLLTTTAAIHSVTTYKHGFFNFRKYNNLQILSALPFSLVPFFLTICCGMCANEQCKLNHQTYLSKKTNEKILTSVGIISIPVGAILGAYTAKAGIQNCKNGWNYKAYVEQQIANIDEINEFIQEQQK